MRPNAAASSKCAVCPLQAQVGTRCMKCYLARAGFGGLVWWERRQKDFLPLMIGRFEALAAGFEVPDPASVAEPFSHGQSRATGASFDKLLNTIKRADEFARREHERSDAASADPPADAGGA